MSWRAVALHARNATRRLRPGRAPKEVSENVWRKRSGEDWIAGYWNDHRAAQRDELIAVIRDRFGVPESVLDVGCNAGPNLRRIAAEFPGCRLSGFDINEEAIVAAQRLFVESGIAAELSVGSLYAVLPRLPTGSADVVLSSFVLAYVPPAHLEKVLADVVRIARRGVVLAEPHAFGVERPPGILRVPWYDWRHDYAQGLVAVGVPRARITVFDTPSPGSVDAGMLVADLR